jgi:hypothetical protein
MAFSKKRPVAAKENPSPLVAVERLDRMNREAARIVLCEPGKYPVGSAMHTWAAMAWGKPR